MSFSLTCWYQDSESLSSVPWKWHYFPCPREEPRGLPFSYEPFRDGRKKASLRTKWEFPAAVDLESQTLSWSFKEFSFSKVLRPVSALPAGEGRGIMTGVSTALYKIIQVEFSWLKERLSWQSSKSELSPISSPSSSFAGMTSHGCKMAAAAVGPTSTFSFTTSATEAKPRLLCWRAC